MSQMFPFLKGIDEGMLSLFLSLDIILFVSALALLSFAVYWHRQMHGKTESFRVVILNGVPEICHIKAASLRQAKAMAEAMVSEKRAKGYLVQRFENGAWRLAEEGRCPKKPLPV